MPNALDINELVEPKNSLKPSMMMDLVVESAMRAAPSSDDASAVYIVKPRPPPFNTFPRKKVSKKPTLERIYDRIYDEIPNVCQASDQKDSAAVSIEVAKSTGENTKM